jgi:tRNA 2-thiouridine synthesizing protein A
MELKIKKTIDLWGLNFPQIIIKSMQAIRRIRIGQILEIITSDPGSVKDIPTWATATKQEVLLVEERGPEDFRFLIKRQK